jgi:bifunctional NMN adenylyltransferase/nudix hydrolase
VVLPLRDYPYSNNTWIQSVQVYVQTAVKNMAIKLNTSLSNITLVGSDRDESTWYLHSFPQWKLELSEAYKSNGNISATSVREVMYESDQLATDLKALDDRLPKSTLQFLWSFAINGGLDELRRQYKFIKWYKARWATTPEFERVLEKAISSGFFSGETLDLGNARTQQPS